MGQSQVQDADALKYWEKHIEPTQPRLPSPSPEPTPFPPPKQKLKSPPPPGHARRTITMCPLHPDHYQCRNWRRRQEVIATVRWPTHPSGLPSPSPQPIPTKRRKLTRKVIEDDSDSD